MTTTILLYGDNNNWFAAYAFWQLKYYGHKDVRLINRGRKKWLEEKRALTKDPVNVAPATYRVSASMNPFAAYKDDVLALVDGRKPDNSWMFVPSTSLLARLLLAGMTETPAPRTHPQGANISLVSKASNEDGTFKSLEDLQTLYQSKGISGADEVIAYAHR